MAVDSERIYAYVESMRTPEEVKSFFETEIPPDVSRWIKQGSHNLSAFLGITLTKAKTYIREVLTPKFWSSLSSDNNPSALRQALETYTSNVRRLFRYHEILLGTMDSCSTISCALLDMSRLIELFDYAGNCVMKHGNSSFKDVLINFHRTCMSATFNRPPTYIHQIVTAASSARESIQTLRLDRVHDDSLLEAFYLELTSFLSLKTKCEDRPDRVWKETYVQLTKVSQDVCAKFLESATSIETAEAWKERLPLIALKNSRFKKLFEIVSDFPDSEPAVKDIKACLDLGDPVFDEMVVEYLNQIKDRLLHAGTSTNHIVRHFLKSARAFAGIDSTRDMLPAVGRVYMDYLRGRTDTAKCIASAIVDTEQDGPCALEEALDPSHNHFVEEGMDVDSDARREIEAIVYRGRVVDEEEARRKAVFVAVDTLVSIYDSEEAFIDEYRRFLADQLIVKSNYDCTREHQVLEALKRRYGAAPLHDCEVMLNDVVQSRELNQSLFLEVASALDNQSGSEEGGQKPDISAIIVSYIYWPKNQDPDIKLPDYIERGLEIYSQKYFEKKSPRKLTWNKAAGVVSLDVTLGGETRKFRVNPIQAMIIIKFGESESGSIGEAELAESIGISQQLLRSKVAFWIANGVIEETFVNGEMLYTRRNEMAPPDIAAVDAMSDEEASTVPPVVSDAEAKLACFKTYIMDYLNLRPSGASLDQLHSFLGKFVRQCQFDMTRGQLADYLEKLIKQNLIQNVNGEYKPAT